MKTTDGLLFEPLSQVLVRAPVLPVEDYGRVEVQRRPIVRRALAISSASLAEQTARGRSSAKQAKRVERSILRYLLRMSTRPTPYGLAAGVGLARWGETSTISLSERAFKSRTRPDMEWLLAVVAEMESSPDVRKQLGYLTNPGAHFRNGRVVLSDQADLESPQRRSTSIRATATVIAVLEQARQRATYADLVRAVRSVSPNANDALIDDLLSKLWRTNLLVTDLRPPLTVPNPADYVVERLSQIDGARQVAADLAQAISDGHASDREGIGADSAAQIAASASKRLAAIQPAPTGNYLQIDSVLDLAGHDVSVEVGKEAARAAELLLRMTPFPQGRPNLVRYRRDFITLYGEGREVPLLELADDESGLGPPLRFEEMLGSPESVAELVPKQRDRILVELAGEAIRRLSPEIALDASMVDRLQTWDPSASTAPATVELNVYVGARSAEALDAGEFDVIVAPNVGAPEAGRSLGRFGDLLGLEAHNLLRQAAECEAAFAADRLPVELVYVPLKARVANVAIRPVLRSHQTVIGTWPADDIQLVPLDQIVIGVDGDQFYARWLTCGKRLTIGSHHMVNPRFAPPACRLLAELGQEARPQLVAFDWGIAECLPYLPRVRHGRVILRPAQWRLRPYESGTSDARARERLQAWREQWQVPRYVSIGAADVRLVLDFEDEAHVHELDSELRRVPSGSQLVIQEAIPRLDQAWLPGPGGHHVAELVVFLRNRRSESHQAALALPRIEPLGSQGSIRGAADGAIRPPGSDWLYLKLYCGRAFEERLMLEHIAPFAAAAVAGRLAERWFFVRYNDPGPHVRLRFHGDPERLRLELQPRVCAWGRELLALGAISSFCIDTYCRELDRFGGTEPLDEVEAWFGVDSRSVVQMLGVLKDHGNDFDRLDLAVWSVAELLIGFGFADDQRLEWCQCFRPYWHLAGPAYRERQRRLRQLIVTGSVPAESEWFPRMQEIIDERRSLQSTVTSRLRGLLENSNSRASWTAVMRDLIHLHCNRLLGTDRKTEGLAGGLLLRVLEGARRQQDLPARSPKSLAATSA